MFFTRFVATVGSLACLGRGRESGRIFSHVQSATLQLLNTTESYTLYLLKYGVFLITMDLSDVSRMQPKKQRPA